MPATDRIGEGARKRVALLAREGAARDHLRQALADAGAEIVLQADPGATDVDALRAAAPQAVLVALEAAVEDALARLDDALNDPAVMAIYDDAEVAARRSGWDAQRWARHLSAKLHGHRDVLPPGGESDEAQLLPGLPRTPAELHADARFEPHLREAQDSAHALPSDGLSLLGDETPAAAGHAFADEPEMWQPPTRPLDDALVDGFDAPDAGTADSGGAPVEGMLADGAQRPAAEPFVETILETPVQAKRPTFAGLHLELEALDHGTPLSGTAATPGAVLLFAGIGGPDAVRKLLAELPADFPRPVLVHLRLDGGRYDNLVRQLERVASLPVVLATAGEAAQAAHVYVVPNEVAVRSDNGGVRFGEGPADFAGLVASLAPEHSAVLLLSGSESAHVGPALALMARGGLAAGQSPQGCYDPAAAKALAARGGASGTPAELAARLLERSY